jgi:hypothetical protein
MREKKEKVERLAGTGEGTHWPSHHLGEIRRK